MACLRENADQRMDIHIDLRTALVSIQETEVRIQVAGGRAERAHRRRQERLPGVVLGQAQ